MTDPIVVRVTSSHPVIRDAHVEPVFRTGAGVYGPQGPQGPQGPTGDTGIYEGATPPTNTDQLWLDTSDTGAELIGEVRSDQSGVYSYIGVAPMDSAEGDPVWTITRITLASPITTGVATGVAWSARAGATYS